MSTGSSVELECEVRLNFLDKDKAKASTPPVQRFMPSMAHFCVSWLFPADNHSSQEWLVFNMDDYCLLLPLESFSS
jgi:hypothetical protein